MVRDKMERLDGLDGLDGLFPLTTYAAKFEWD